MISVFTVFRFRATLYPCPETQQERREMAIGVMTRIEDLNTVRFFYTVKSLKIWTHKKFALIILLFEQGGFTIEQWVRMEWQTV